MSVEFGWFRIGFILMLLYVLFVINKDTVTHNKSNPIIGLDRPSGFQEVEASGF
jgi:hypothetical protein